jgi:ribosomal protein S18 acetylase RimI-like enzyme
MSPCSNVPVRDVPELPTREENAAVLATFDPLPPERQHDPYMLAGCHPDAVAWVWDTLGASLSRPCAFVTAGHPVLAHPTTFVIFAFPRGTAYALWLPPPVRQTVDDLKTVQHWSGGARTDIEAVLGEGWVWGQCQQRERGWCQAALDWLDEHASRIRRPANRGPTLARVRPARPEDGPRIGQVHVEAWRVGYRGQMPDAYLDGLDPAERGAHWREALEAGGGAGRSVFEGEQTTVSVIEDDDGEIVGISAIGAARECPDADVGELWMINLSPSVWGRGFGQQLLAEVTVELERRRYRQAILWVLDTNARARRFYELSGWRLDGGEKVDAREGFSLRELRYRRILSGGGASARP